MHASAKRTEYTRPRLRIRLAARTSYSAEHLLSSKRNETPDLWVKICGPGMPISYTSRGIALLFCGPIWLLANAAAAETPTFKSTARVVTLDVVLSDSNGKPVHGLKAQDFRVMDNGKAQEIVAF